MSAVLMMAMIRKVCTLLTISAATVVLSLSAAELPQYRVLKTNDFTIEGSSESKVWDKAPWMELTSVNRSNSSNRTRARMLWSAQGLYVQFECHDTKITASKIPDGGELYMQDVVEVFLQPEADRGTYLEVEISPHGSELVLLNIHNGRGFQGWQPWRYGPKRKVLKEVSVYGGRIENGATVQAWRVQMMIPWALIGTLPGVPPASGSQWRANLGRIDYDNSDADGADVISWAPLPKPAFHNPSAFGVIVFE